MRTRNNLGCDSAYLPGEDFRKDVENGHKHVAELVVEKTFGREILERKIKDYLPTKEDWRLLLSPLLPWLKQRRPGVGVEAQD